MITDRSILSEHTLQWVERFFEDGARVQKVTPLLGGISAAVYLISISMEGQADREVVLRQFTNKDWIKDEPDLVLHEAASLAVAAQANIQTPGLIGEDPTGEHSGIPSVLMTKLDGRVDLQPQDMKKWLSNIVDAMVRIHQVQISGEWSWEYRAYRDMGHIQVPSWTRQPHLWEEAKSRLSRFRPQVHPVFIHRDFHPTNFLWVGEDLSGVVDWVNACRGPAGIDLGHCRVNLAQLYGVETADLLLQFYNSHPDRATEYDPYWDLITFMDFHMDKPTVYGGWEALGIHHLTDDLMLDRCEIYLHSILARF